MHGTNTDKLDQRRMPLVEALIAAQAIGGPSFGAPGHKRGASMPIALKALLGRRVFKADILSPKGLDDRTESLHALQRAHEIAAEAWGADLCRFSTGGSTQSVQTALAAVARPGETVLVAANAHKSEFSCALFAGLNIVPIRPTIHPDFDIEHGPALATVADALERHPDARAVLVVSPTYFGTTCDVAGIARLCHGRGVPLIVDAAWGGAFGFSELLPESAVAAGADIVVASLHKTMGSLAQGSVLLARGSLVDQERLALAYELFQTTSPSVPILATLDATRSEHACDGAAIWRDVVEVANDLRAQLAAIDGLRLLDAAVLDGDGARDLDRTKIAIDVSALGVAGYAIDDWMWKNHNVIMGLSDARTLLAVLAPGTRPGEARQLRRALKAFVRALRRDPSIVPRVPEGLPRLSDLTIEPVMPAADAFFARAVHVPYEQAEGRTAAEILAPAPPGVPRLMPGQRISAAHVEFLVKNRDAGMFLLDPADPSEHEVRVVA